MKLTVLANTLICGVIRLPKLFCCYITGTVLINTRWCEATRLPKLFCCSIAGTVLINTRWCEGMRLPELICCHSAGTVLINTRWCEVMRLPSLFCGLNAGSVLACSKVHRTKGNISQRPATMFAVCNQWHGDTEENELAVRGVVSVSYTHLTLPTNAEV